MDSHIQVKNAKLMAVTIMLGSFVGLFGETALNMALTTIMADFKITAPTAQWLTTGYLLVMATLVPLSAYLMRWFTTRQLFTIGTASMIVGSLFAALALNFPMLLMGRLIQAIGTGIFIPLMFNVILMIFPMNKRGTMMGVVGLVITAGPALGPTISGLIINIANWHYIFIVMIVFNVVIFVFGARYIENISQLTRPKIDVLSLAFSTVGFGGFVFAMSTLAESSMTELVVWLPLIIGLIALLLFVMRQFKMEAPMINLRVFQYPMFALGTFLMFCNLFMILSIGILMPIYLTGVLGFTALAAGFIMLPGNLMNIIMSPVVGSSFDKIGPKVYTRVGYTLLTVSSLLFVLTISATTPVWLIIVLLMIFFIGVPMAITAAQTNGMNQLPPHLYTDGSAAMNTLTQVSGALGTAIAVTMYTLGQQKYKAANVDALTADMLAYGIHYAYIVVLVVAVVGFIGALFIKNSRQSA